MKDTGCVSILQSAVSPLAVEDYVPSLIADKGGETEVSFAEMKVMELAGVARACWALAMVAGNLDAVARFLAAERSALSDVGLERRPTRVPSLHEVLEASPPANSDGDAAA